MFICCHTNELCDTNMRNVFQIFRFSLSVTFKMYLFVERRTVEKELCQLDLYMLNRNQGINQPV